MKIEKLATTYFVFSTIGYILWILHAAENNYVPINGPLAYLAVLLIGILHCELASNSAPVKNLKLRVDKFFINKH